MTFLPTVLLALAAPHAQGLDPQLPRPVEAYLEGLDALVAGRATEAEAAFTRALGAASEDARLWTARGVARLAIERLEDAVPDLDRALRLDPASTQARLWRANASSMSADFFGDTQFFPAATHDPEETTAREAALAYGNVVFRRRDPYDDFGGDPDPLAGPRRMLAESAAWFARKAKEDPALRSAIVARALARSGEAGRAAEVLEDLERAFAGAPEEPRVLVALARARLAVGDAEGARKLATRALVADERGGEALAVRARAAVRLGDARRARADLATLARLRAAEAAELERELADALGILEARRAEGQGLLATIVAAARAGEAETGLAERAGELLRLENGRRRRCDEAYQDELARLRERVRAAPKDARPPAELARFLVEHATVPSERVEPRGERRELRERAPGAYEGELAQALEAADAALVLDPRSVLALAAKAEVLMRRGLYGDAETILRQALERDPESGPVLELFSRLLEVAAAQKSGEAAMLRSPKYLGTTSERVGDYIYTYTWWSDPSPAELERAEALEQRAAACLELAQRAIERAADERAGTAEGHYYRGLLAWKRGELEAARAEYAESLRLDPGHPRRHFNLAAIASALGDPAGALEAQLAGLNQLETTASPLLELVWHLLAQARTERARAALARAAEIDPSDARVQAYLGAVAEADGQLEEALARYTAAAALEGARLALAGEGANGGRPLAYAELARRIETRRRAGEILLSLGRAEEALAAFEEGLTLEPRLAPARFGDDLALAMLPSLDLDPGRVPEAENGLSLAAWCRVGAGRALEALGRGREVLAVCEPVQGYELAYVNGRGAQRVQRPRLHALALRCRAHLALDELDLAERCAQSLPRQRTGAGPSKSPYPELEQAGSRLQEEVQRRRMERRALGDERSEEWFPPDPSRVAALLADIGPRIGHPELASASGRFQGDAREVELCVAVQQAATMLATPKSVRWRDEVALGIGLVALRASELRAEAARFAGREPRPGERDWGAQLAQVAERADAAVARLSELAIEAGYPQPELEQELAAFLASRGVPAGPVPGGTEPAREERRSAAPPDGPARGSGTVAAPPAARAPSEADVAFEALARDLGLPDPAAERPSGDTGAFSLARQVRAGVDAIHSAQGPFWRANVRRALVNVQAGARRSEQTAAALRRQLEDQRKRKSRNPASEEQIEARLRDEEARGTNARSALARLVALADGKGYPKAELEADLAR